MSLRTLLLKLGRRAMRENEKIAQAEADLVYARLIQLSENPIKGNIDAEYLRKINFQIFQDMPKLGLSDYTPGIYREEVQAGKDWIKERALESVEAKTIVSYSPMDKRSIADIDNALREADNFSSLSLPDFSKKVTQLYVDLDYLHPFPDGNSRTLRALTAQLAKEHNYHIDWERFNHTKNGRDVLYIARDLSVCEKALENVRNNDTKRDLYYTLDTFSDNKNMQRLLPEVIRPYRAFVFEKFEREDALKTCPELSNAYRIMDSARESFRKEKGSNAVSEEIAVIAVREKIQRSLNKGVSSETETLIQSIREPEVNKERISKGLER